MTDRFGSLMSRVSLERWGLGGVCTVRRVYRQAIAALCLLSLAAFTVMLFAGMPREATGSTAAQVFVATPVAPTPTPAPPAPTPNGVVVTADARTPSPTDLDHCDDPYEISIYQSATGRPGLQLPGGPPLKDPPQGTAIAGPPTQVFTSAPTPATSATSPPLAGSYSRVLVSTKPLADEIKLRQAHAIAVVTVIGCGPARWNTPGNQKPADAGPGVYRPVFLRVEQQIKGMSVGQTIRTITAGGIIDGRLHQVEPRNRYFRGQRALVLVEAPVASPMDGETIHRILEKDSVDANGYATDDLYPQRRWILTERIRQIQAGIAATP